MSTFNYVAEHVCKFCHRPYTAYSRTSRYCFRHSITNNRGHQAMRAWLKVWESHPEIAIEVLKEVEKDGARQVD